MLNEYAKPHDLRMRTKQFALRIIKLSVALPNSEEGKIIRRQVCRSGTSVGAQYREVCRSRSKAEFISKFESALQELDETLYWLELIEESGMQSESRLPELVRETDELIAVFTQSIKTAKDSD